MRRSDLTDFRILIVPGLHGSGPGHWQTRWKELFPRFKWVVQDDWDTPDLAVWSSRLNQVLRESPAPTLVIAHSFGCLTTVHLASAGVAGLAGALLVAPADPVKFGVETALKDARVSFPSVVVGSLDDPWMEAGRAAQWAKRWGSGFVNAGKLGHINADSKLGDWTLGLTLLRNLAADAGKQKSTSRDLALY